MPESRTKRTIQNSRMSLVIFLLQIIIGFYSRKIFLLYLGDEVLGLNTTLNNILGFLNLAEFGIGIAMATSLYKPIHDKNHQAICEILCVQGALYRRIAYFLCCVSIPVILCLPIIFPQTGCSIFYIYSAYIVFLSGSIFSYLWNYRQILIQADQKNYKLLPWIHCIRYAKVILQIFFLVYIKCGIWGWIVLEFIGNIITVFAINYVIKKEYPWLSLNNTSTALLYKKYKNLIKKIKQVFIHKIALFVIEQTTPLIIYAFVSLTMVTYYGNYIMLFGYVSTMINVIFEGMGASIGNLVAEGHKKNTLNVFWELHTSRLWISAIACFSMYIIIDPFISIWIGDKYLLSDKTLLIIILGYFIRMTRSVIDSFKNAYQLFADIWAPIAEAIIHLGFSIILGFYWGLNGILIGGILSQIIIVLIWKPYYTLRNGLRTNPIVYYFQYSFQIILLASCAYFTKYIHTYYIEFYNLQQNQTSLFFQIGISILLYAFITYILLLLLTRSMRSFTNRIINIITHRI